MFCHEGPASIMTGPQPFRGIPRSESFGAVSKWVCAEHERRWRLHRGIGISKMVLQSHSSRVASSLVIGVITGHGHLRKDPLCRMCDEQDETAEQLLFDCPSIARERYAIFCSLDKGGEFPQENLIGCFRRFLMLCFRGVQKALEADIFFHELAALAHCCSLTRVPLSEDSCHGTPPGHNPNNNVRGARLRQQSRAAPGALGKVPVIAKASLPLDACQTSYNHLGLCFWPPDNSSIH
ncbi:hypothetical protein J6590_066421 [Homalodisca vitripennis]|nr:hypothetical protein J6590_066421 [Homalodisca vitripennis]